MEGGEASGSSAEPTDPNNAGRSNSTPPEIQAILDQAEMLGMDIMFLDDMVKQAKEGNLMESGIAEFYSVPRVSARANRHDLQQGWALDLLTGWDLSDGGMKEKARKLLNETRPKLLIGSPMCTFFSSIMNLNWRNMAPERAEQCYREAVAHMQFATELYRAQLEAGRLFLHEHPRDATSWKLECIQDLMRDPRVATVNADQCMLGLMSRDSNGEWAPSRKATKFMTNCPEIAARLNVVCDGNHDHVRLLGGRAGRAAQYPVKLCDEICAGLCDHLMRAKIQELEGNRENLGVYSLEGVDSGPTIVRELGEMLEIIRDDPTDQSSLDLTSSELSNIHDETLLLEILSLSAEGSGLVEPGNSCADVDLFEGWPLDVPCEMDSESLCTVAGIHTQACGEGTHFGTNGGARRQDVQQNGLPTRVQVRAYTSDELDESRWDVVDDVNHGRSLNLGKLRDARLEEMGYVRDIGVYKYAW